MSADKKEKNGQNLATSAIVGRGPAELREAKKRPPRKHHWKQPVAASRLTNKQTYNLKNKEKHSDLLKKVLELKWIYE